MANQVLFSSEQVAALAAALQAVEAIPDTTPGKFKPVYDLVNPWRSTVAARAGCRPIEPRDARPSLGSRLTRNEVIRLFVGKTRSIASSACGVRQNACPLIATANFTEQSYTEAWHEPFQTLPANALIKEK